MVSTSGVNRRERCYHNTLAGALCRRTEPLESRLSLGVCLMPPKDCLLGMKIPDIRRWLSASVVSEADFLMSQEGREDKE